MKLNTANTLTLYQNTTNTISLSVLNDDGTNYNTVGTKFLFDVTTGPGQPSVLQLTDTSPQVALGNGLVTITLTAADINAIPAAGYVYEALHAASDMTVLSQRLESNRGSFNVNASNYSLS